VEVFDSAIDRVTDREIMGLTVSFRVPVTVPVADEVLDCVVELVKVPECVEVFDCEELPENVVVTVLVFDCAALRVYDRVPVIVAVSDGLTDGPGAAETVGVSDIVTVSVLEIRGVAETQVDEVDVLLIRPVIVRVELVEGETVFLIVPVGLFESLRLLVIPGVTVEHALAVDVLLTIIVLVLVLVTAMLAEEVPVAVCDLVRGAERVRVEDALGVFD